MNSPTQIPQPPPEAATPSGHHSAGEPAEERGIERDEVRMLVGSGEAGHDVSIEHRVFRDLPAVLRPGDLLLVNNSRTLPARLEAVELPSQTPVVLHLSTRYTDAPTDWIVEPRVPRPDGATEPLSTHDAFQPRTGTCLRLSGGGSAVLHGRCTDRLWYAALDTGRVPVTEYLYQHGKPIRHRYVGRHWPLAAYQTAFATVPGSAEMPSAGRPFTPETVTRLVASGVLIAPITLHTGVASPGADERPYREWCDIPAATAELVNHVRDRGGRVIAVGTTVVRAVESAVGSDGFVGPFRGYTDLVISAARGVHAVDGILTGFHEPHASHLLILNAVAGPALVSTCYRAAEDKGGYLWHEFGDVNLLIGRGP